MTEAREAVRPSRARDWKARALLALAALAACGDPAPRARAERLGTLDDAIGGPHAIGRVGDFLLENDQIRLVISDTGVSTDPSKTTMGRVNTTYGGSLVDADLRRVGGGNGKGNDQLAELLPGMLFTVINPTKITINKDGSDGGAAEILVEGSGGDLLQAVALLNIGLLQPAGLSFQTIYRLKPGAKYVEIETTIRNKGSGAHPLPFLNPQELKDLGFDVPGVENLQLSVPVGMLPLLGGEQDLFAPGVAGFNVKYAIEDSYKIAGGFPAFPGLAVDFLASRGEGVSYGLTVPMSPANYVNAYRAGYPDQDITPYSILMPFTYAGVAGVYMFRPPDQLLPNEQFTYTAYFVIGDGDVSSVADTIYELRGVATGGFGGRIVDAQTGAAVAGADVIVLDDQGRPVNQLETDAQGSFFGKLPAGNYSYVVVTGDRETSRPAPFTVTANAKTGVHIALDPPATLVVSVIDEQGRHAPSKIQLIGRFAPENQGDDPRTFLYSLPLGESTRPTAFDGGTRFIEGAWWTADGRVLARVRPGTYDLVVSRGPEYEVTTRSVTLEAGKFEEAQLVLVPAYTSPGWVSIDSHLHAAPSTDSGLPIDQRVISCAAEGLEVAVATDHNYITDYAPAIASNGLDGWLLGIPGIELTTFEMGHFNGYPLRVDPGSTRGGEFLWAGQPPQKLFDQLRDLAVDKATSIVQVNHPRQQVLGYFAQFFIDADTAEPYTPAGILGVFAPYGDEFAAENFSYDFDAIELITGQRVEDAHTFRAPNPLPPGPFPDPQPIPGEVVVSADGRAQFPGTVDTWFTMLDRGHRATGMGTSDTHHLLGSEPGYARTLLFVGQGRDTPGGYSRDDVVKAIRDHRAITTNGPFLTITSGEAMIGDTVTGNSVVVRARVESPKWALPDRIIVYSNSAVLLDQAIPEGQREDFEVTVTVRPTTDAWVVAEVTGSQNMFPVLTATEFPPLDATVIIQALSVGLDLSTLPLASNLKPQRVHASTPYAITNPIWIDADSNGTWTPPKPPLPAKTKRAGGPLPDVRAQFDALPEVSP